MHRSNNAVIMQTEQLGRIEALEEELRSSRGKVADLEQKMMEQDRVIAQLVGDNLDHLQANMRLTAHINSSTERAERMEHRLGQVVSVVMGFLEGRMESLMEETSGSSGSGGSDASGVDRDGQVSDGIGLVAGALAQVMREGSPIPRETRLIEEMEREAEEAGAGGWFNGNPEDVPESWSGANSDASASQDQVGVTLLTTIGGRTLPNPVRVPDNLVHPAVLTSLMEGPIRPWQCLVWSEESPPQYSRDLPVDHTSRPGGILLQVGPSLIDIDGEYRGGGVVEEVEEENEGGGASIE